MGLKRIVGIFMFVGVIALVAILLASNDAEATRTVQTLDCTVRDTIENTTASAGVTLTWLGGGAWDGTVSFEWFDNTDSLAFQENVAPDGIGTAFSSYNPDWLGTWHVNASFTGNNPEYDNESFEVISPSIQVINNITWSNDVDVTMQFHRDITWVGQGQDFRAIVKNSSSGDPIQGVEMSAAIVTSDLETVLPTTVIGTTNHLGEVYYSFLIPVRDVFEDRFMAVELNIVSIDYTGINGWLYHSHEAFYCGYYFQFVEEGNLTLATGEEYNVSDEVVVNVDYTHGYNGSYTATAIYQIINTTTDELYGGGEVDYLFNPGVTYDFFPFPLPLGLDPGNHRVQGYLRIDVPNTEEKIEVFARSEPFNITDTKGITFNNLPFAVSSAEPNITVGDVIFIEVNRTFYVQTQQSVSIGFTNIDTGLQFFPTTTTAFTEETGVRLVPITIPRGLLTGNYVVNGQVSYTIDGVTETVEYGSQSFFVHSVLADASSDIDVFANYTGVELDGSHSHGYNDSYWGLRWTNTLEPTKTWYGLYPIMVFNETGTFTITLNVTDGDNNYSEDSFLVHVVDHQDKIDPNNRPLIITVPPTSVAVGDEYLVPLQYIDVDDPEQVVAFSLVTDAGWLSINQTTGVLSGTPTEGTYSVEVTVTDSAGASSSIQYSLEVSANTVEESTNATMNIVIGMGAVLMIILVFGILSKAFKKDDGGGDKGGKV